MSAFGKSLSPQIRGLGQPVVLLAAFRWPERATQLLPAAMGVVALALGYALVRVSAPWRARGVSGFRGSFHIEFMFTDVRLFAGVVLGALGYFLMLGGGILVGVGLILAFL